MLATMLGWVKMRCETLLLDRARELVMIAMLGTCENLTTQLIALVHHLYKCFYLNWDLICDLLDKSW
jgi:hypothetical protein